MPTSSLLAMLLLFSATHFALSQTVENVQWVQVEALEETIAKEPRPVFFDIYTSWCGWCKVMDKKTFTDPEVVSYVSEHFYAVKLDAESQEIFRFGGKETSGRDMARSFGVKGYPTIVLMQASLETHEVHPGYRKPKPFLNLLSKFAR